MPVNSFPTSPADRGAPGIASTPVLSRDRLTLEYRTAAAPAGDREDGQDVIVGLTQQPKVLPPKYFYDDRGSQLFEDITRLPEYYPTRTERQILQQYGRAIAAVVGPCDLIELGSGSSHKTRVLLDAYRQQECPLHYVPVDVSGGILEDSARQLLEEYPSLTLHGLVSTYEVALSNLPAKVQNTRLMAFIGSTLGNLSPQACDDFLQQVSESLAIGDYFLLGVDLHKDRSILEAAYNDAQGVTAAFNLNMLHHLNWRFQGDFDPQQFRHVAFYNDRDRQMELYIESLCQQTVTLKTLDLTVPFAQGERLLSELSRKFDVAALAQDLQHHRLRVMKTYTDDKQWFGLLLCQRV